MRIDAFNKVSQLYQTGTPKKVAKPNNAKKAYDSLEISFEGKLFKAAQQSVAAVPDIRLDLANSIKQKMDSNAYDVTNEELADKLLENYSW